MAWVTSCVTQVHANHEEPIRKFARKFDCDVHDGIAMRTAAQRIYGQIVIGKGLTIASRPIGVHGHVVAEPRQDDNSNIGGAVIRFAADDPA